MVVHVNDHHNLFQGSIPDTDGLAIISRNSALGIKGINNLLYKTNVKKNVTCTAQHVSMHACVCVWACVCA